MWIGSSTLRREFAWMLQDGVYKGSEAMHTVCCEKQNSSTPIELEDCVETIQAAFETIASPQNLDIYSLDLETLS